MGQPRAALESPVAGKWKVLSAAKADPRTRRSLAGRGANPCGPDNVSKAYLPHAQPEPPEAETEGPGAESPELEN